MLNMRLISERERLCMTQNELANRCDVTVTTQSNYETGRRQPTADYLVKAAQAGIDVKYVLTGERCERVFDVEKVAELEAMVKQLLDFIDTLKGDTR
jgi:transcriptional regulator with XRE-family HTH domain